MREGGITSARATQLAKERGLKSDKYTCFWIDEMRTEPQIIRTYFDDKLNFKIEVYEPRHAEGIGNILQFN